MIRFVVVCVPSRVKLPKTLLFIVVVKSADSSVYVLREYPGSFFASDLATSVHIAATAGGLARWSTHAFARCQGLDLLNRLDPCSAGGVSGVTLTVRTSPIWSTFVLVLTGIPFACIFSYCRFFCWFASFILIIITTAVCTRCVCICC